jgi:HEPN domain-containing protein
MFSQPTSREKYLKAYLVRKKIHFPRTHDLIVLKNLCVKGEGDFELIDDLVISLHPYAVEFRYPGEQATRRDSIRSLRFAKDIRKFVRKKLR